MPRNDASRPRAALLPGTRFFGTRPQNDTVLACRCRLRHEAERRRAWLFPLGPPNIEQNDDSIKLMTREEGLRLLDRQAREILGMSGEEFVVRYRTGEIEDPFRLEVARVAILLPLAEL